jgi:hypothetical protein
MNTSFSLNGTFGKRKSRGTTPTTSCGEPSSVIVRPTAAGSPPKRRRQKPSVTTTASLAPSSGRNVRPTIGANPIVANRFGVERTPISCSGSPSPVRLTVAGTTGAISSRDCALWCQSA